jgi:DNA ligase-4
MLPTPVPTSPAETPEPMQVVGAGEIVYPAPPQNAGAAPFSVLAMLFDRLANERKPEKRRKLLDGWFNVGKVNAQPNAA